MMGEVVTMAIADDGEVFFIIDAGDKNITVDLKGIKKAMIDYGFEGWNEKV